jgi:hypothetical protein
MSFLLVVPGERSARDPGPVMVMINWLVSRVSLWVRRSQEGLCRDDRLNSEISGATATPGEQPAPPERPRRVRQSERV